MKLATDVRAASLPPTMQLNPSIARSVSLSAIILLLLGCGNGEEEYNKAMQIANKTWGNPHLGNDTKYEAIELFAIAADKGHADAQYQLGVAYRNGIATRENHEKSAEYFQQAAEQGHPLAKTSFAYFLLRGIGVPKDIEKASKLFHETAAYGDPGAHEELGRMYFEGEGVEKDIVEAYKWTFMATRSMTQFEAPALLRKLKEQITPEQLTEAEKSIKEWKPKPIEK